MHIHIVHNVARPELIALERKLAKQAAHQLFLPFPDVASGAEAAVGAALLVDAAAAAGAVTGALSECVICRRKS